MHTESEISEQICYNLYKNLTVELWTWSTLCISSLYGYNTHYYHDKHYLVYHFKLYHIWKLEVIYNKLLSVREAFARNKNPSKYCPGKILYIVDSTRSAN